MTYINNNHDTNSAFSTWWIQKCVPPTLNIALAAKPTELLSKTGEAYKYYAEQLMFRITKKKPTKISVKAVIVKEDIISGEVLGQDLLYDWKKLDCLPTEIGAYLLTFLNVNDRNAFGLISTNSVSLSEVFINKGGNVFDG